MSPINRPNLKEYEAMGSGAGFLFVPLTRCQASRH